MKEHPFFRGIDWQHVYLRKVPLGTLWALPVPPASPPQLPYMPGLVTMERTPAGEAPLSNCLHPGQKCLSFACVVQPSMDGNYSEEKSQGVLSTPGLLLVISAQKAQTGPCPQGFYPVAQRAKTPW